MWRRDVSWTLNRAAAAEFGSLRAIVVQDVDALDQTQQSASFDSDLFYRLNRIHIKGGAHLSHGC